MWLKQAWKIGHKLYQSTCNGSLFWELMLVYSVVCSIYSQIKKCVYVQYLTRLVGNRQFRTMLINSNRGRGWGQYVMTNNASVSCLLFLCFPRCCLIASLSWSSHPFVQNSSSYCSTPFVVFFPLPPPPLTFLLISRFLIHFWHKHPAWGGTRILHTWQLNDFVSHGE